MDPYVILTCRSQEQESSVASGAGSEPEWNENFVFTLSDGVTELTLKILDSDTSTGDDFVGEATIPLDPVFLEGSLPPAGYNVVKNGEYCGEIPVGLTFSPEEEERSRSRGLVQSLRSGSPGRGRVQSPRSAARGQVQSRPSLSRGQSRRSGLRSLVQSRRSASRGRVQSRPSLSRGQSSRRASRGLVQSRGSAGRVRVQSRPSASRGQVQSRRSASLGSGQRRRGLVQGRLSAAAALSRAAAAPPRPRPGDELIKFLDLKMTINKLFGCLIPLLI